jgi:hypothetical protein
LIRSVNGTLDPSEVGDALLSHAAEWFPADCLVVAIQDGSPEPLIIRSGDLATSMKKPLPALPDGLQSTMKSS